jgi:flagellar export protein FliJ
MNRRIKLGVVLRLRELEEEEARAELAAAVEAHRRAVTARDDTATELARRSMDLTEIQLQPGASDRLIGAARALLAAGERREHANVAVKSAADMLMNRRGRLAEVSRRREVVERLRDRILAEERLAEDRLEQAVANEMATTRHVWLAVMEADR